MTKIRKRIKILIILSISSLKAIKKDVIKNIVKKVKMMGKAFSFRYS